MPLNDLIEEGNLGLLKAADRFDISRNCRFSTHATWWIKQGVERALMNQVRMVRLPIHVLKKSRYYQRKISALEAKLDRAPTLREIAIALKKPETEVAEFLHLFENTLSLDAPADADSGTTIGSHVKDRSDGGIDPCEQLQTSDLKHNLLDRVAALPKKHQEVLMRHFGLFGHHATTLTGIGKELGLTRERVRQIQIDALHRLKVALEARGLFEI
jgi:RNA polymerase nonessential primary-like sigma factor